MENCLCKEQKVDTSAIEKLLELTNDEIKKDNDNLRHEIHGLERKLSDYISREERRKELKKIEKEAKKEEKRIEKEREAQEREVKEREAKESKKKDDCCGSKNVTVTIA
jgi:hypothetical protein